jgi:uncharacterized protein (DUF849 family)
VLIQAALNGSRRPGDHPALPLTPAQLARDAAQVVEAGARELHVHPRRADGAETLEASACDETLLAIRHACPGVPVGLSTAAWIDPDPERRQASIGSWTEPPNFASVNFAEEEAMGLSRLLNRLGIGIEAAVWTVADAEALLASGFERHIVRVIVEPQETDPVEAETTADRISTALDRADARPRVFHGNGISTWRVIEYALEGAWDVRVGLEDTLVLPDGTTAGDNLDLVRAAVKMASDRHLI